MLKVGRRALDVGHWTFEVLHDAFDLQVGRSDVGRWTFDVGVRTLDIRGWTLKAGHAGHAVHVGTVTRVTCHV